MHTLGPVALFYFECSSDVLSPLPLSERSQQQAVDLFSVNTCSGLVLNEIFVFSRLQEFLQEKRSAEPDLLMSGEQKLPHRPTPSQPVPVLQTENLSQNGHEERR
jgi:hypothetical protein